MIYWDERFLTIHWDSEIQAVWMEWKEFIDGDWFRTGLNAGIELLEEKRSRRWLADLRRLGPVAPDDQKWTNEDWFPRAIKSGIRSMALVEPRKIVAQMSVRTIMRKVMEKTLTTAYFDDIPPARQWLRGQR